MKTIDFGKVAVLLGGHSAEREVSLASGQGVLEALLRQGVNAHAFDPAEKNIHDLAGFDRAFIILHGRGGEDGLIQGMLDYLHIPYTGSQVLACALAMDKWRSKLVWQAAGLPVPAYALLDENSDFSAIAGRLGLPLFVKPATEGSSIGVSKVHSVDEFAQAYALALKYDPIVIAEQSIGGGEYTVGIAGDTVMPAIRIVPATEFYDYEAKYSRDDTQYLVPCGLPPAREKEMQILAQEAFHILNGRGWGRIDILTDEQGKPYILEANLVPGMTNHSLVPKAAAALGIGYDELVLRILTQTTRDQ